MARGVRELLEYPFAVPPVRRRRIERLAPEFCAAAVWVLFSWIWYREATGLRLGIWETMGVISGRLGPTGGEEMAGLLPAGLARAALIGSEAGGLLMLVAPVIFVAASFAAERSAGTLESVLLTSTHHNLVVRGRFWYAALPWLRLPMWLFPMYLMIGLEPFQTMSAASWSGPWLNLMAWVINFGKVPGRFIWEDAVTPAANVHCLFLAVMRWLHDCSAMFLCIGATFYVSLRARNTIRAAVTSFMAAPVLVAVVFSPDVIWLAAVTVAGPVLLRRPVQYYWLAALAMMAVRWGAVQSMLARVSRHFDAYVLGEKPDSSEHLPRRRVRRT